MRVVHGFNLLIVVTVAGAIAGSAPDVRAEPGDTGASGSARCASCHEREAASWRHSAHASAWSNEVFQAAYRAEPQPFCRGCHAPLSDPSRAPTALAAQEGVSCVGCHAAPHGGPSDGTTVCARCHEFAFPGPAPVARAATFMQTTVREHRQSPDSAISCADCHMRKDASGGRDHGVIVDATVVQSGLSVSVRASRTGAGIRVRFELSARAGHAVPTGDMMRRLELRTWADGAPVVRAELAREFGDLREGARTARVEVLDTRVPADGRAVVRELDVVAPPGARRVHFAIDRLRMPEWHARVQQIQDETNRMNVTTGVATID
ncbi:MAG: Cytochrome [Labilithrix sp.]|nr:Cytochrome [Labilithrix sp.]